MVVQNRVRDAPQLVAGVCDVVALSGVRPEYAPLLFGELAGLVEDFERDTDLSNVVQQAAEAYLQGFFSQFGHAPLALKCPLAGCELFRVLSTLAVIVLLCFRPLAGCELFLHGSAGTDGC